jgi:ATP-binding cassette subfamily B protein
MKNAPILILDDSASAVDVKTEKAILENLRETRAGKTTILIAHRVSTVEQMDKIIFVDDGKVAACGTYSELLEGSAEFKTLVDLQKLDDADEDAGKEVE